MPFQTCGLGPQHRALHLISVIPADEGPQESGVRRNKHGQPCAAVDTQALPASMASIQPGALMLAEMGSDTLWGQIPTLS